MLNISEELKNLVELQKTDFELEELNSKINDIPAQISRINEELRIKKERLEEEKKLTQKLHLELKEKNLELETLEQSIKKHTAELNAVKTNQAYRALLDEIEAAKKEKSKIEDSILNLMESIDAAAKSHSDNVKSFEAEEKKAHEQIKSLDALSFQLKSEYEAKKPQRDNFTSKISPRFVKIYEQLRSKKNNVAVVPVEGNGCGGCHMKLSSQNLNELYRLYHIDSKAVDLTMCENCSRILYLPDGLPKF